LLEARRAELDAGLAAVEARREYWTAKAELDALLAGRRVQATSQAAPAAALGGAGNNEGGH
jgi:outer membrane protein TolC